MTYEIDRSTLHIDSSMYADAGSFIWMLNPRGWLVAVGIQLNHAKIQADGWPKGMNRNEPTHYEITDPSGTALFGGFNVHFQAGYDRGGIAFEEPLPNMDSSCPYRIECREIGPPVIIRAVNCLPVLG